ncbi:hypothetical protein M5K25_013252 [Dendrobium thyrsiflorum]|uniref:Uncharacterized protein n=1 Tax=Dendrobium thyrsiflorum TaxID=117978 RepID=A0ABD0UST4_DENTH
MVMASSDQSSCNDKRKRAVEVSPQPLVIRPSIFSRMTYPKAKEISERQELPVQPEIKEVMVVSPVQPTLPVQSVPYTPVLPASFPGKPNQFEIGTTSTAVFTRTQIRNRNRRIRRRRLREKKKKENEVMRENSPLLDGSRFHDFFATEEKDDFENMLTSPPRSPKTLNKLTPEERTRKCENQLREVVIRKMEGMNSQSLVPPLIEEDKSPIDYTIEVQPSSSNKQRLVRELAVIDDYGIESQARLTASEEILLLDDTISSPEVPSRPKVFDQTHRMVSWSSTSKTTKVEGPLRFRGLPKEGGSCIPFDEPWVPDYTLNSLLDDKSLGHTSKFAAPSILPSITVGHASSMVKEKEPMEVICYQESVPSPVNHWQPISERSIEKLMNDFRGSLCKMDKEDFDKDNDDFMDEELYGFNTGRSLSLPGDPHTDEFLEVEIKEGGNTALIQQLLQQLKSKDEYIMKLEKRMEEMTTTMTALIMQLVGSQQILAVEKLLANAEKRPKTTNVDDEMGIQRRKDFGYDLQSLSKDDLKEFISHHIEKRSLA